jgi:dTDP-4-dehydrorhamnose 3,5-epimerase
MPFRLEKLEIPGVFLIEPDVFQDERGFLMETYKRSDYAAMGIHESFVQENHSRSSRGILRGLHYQRAPRGQGKLVRAIAGEVFDVAVDLRRGEPTYGKWVAVQLSAANKRMIYIPPWCAHGVCILSADAELLYKVTQEYAPEYEAGVAWNDPTIGIKWPLADPVLSEKDRRWPRLHALEESSGRSA